MSYTFVLCRSTGEPLGELDAAKQRGLTRRLNLAAEAPVVLDLADELSGFLAPGLARLKVYRSPTAAELLANPSASRTLMFYGGLPPSSVRDDAAAGTVTATFADPRWLFPHRYTLGTETYTATDQGSILWSLVNAQNTRFSGAGETWLRQGDTTTGTLRTKTYDRQPLSAMFDQMTGLLDGPDVDVEPLDGYELSPATRQMGVLNVYAQQGQVRPNAHFLYLDEGGGNVGNMTRGYTDIVTYAVLLGQPVANTTVPITSQWGTPETSLHGLFESYGTEQDIVEQALLDSRVRGEVEAFLVPRPVIEVQDPTAEAPVAFVDYDLGDTVRVTCHRGSMRFDDVRLRVHQIDLRLSQEGRENIDLVLSEV